MKRSRFLAASASLHARLALAVVVLAATAAACSGANHGGAPAAISNANLYDPQALPSGPVGDAIRYGHDIIADTPKYMKANITAGMSCAACHLNAGTTARGGSLAGTYAQFPQWNKRAARVITLQDRIAECFLYSMNGRPPNYDSKEMVAMVSYIAWLSRDATTFSTPDPDQGFLVPLPSAQPVLANGATMYTQRCASCHQANGSGVGSFPPLWGSASFNNGAGMAHLDKMTGFVKYNMPLGNATLSVQEAYDVAAFVLSHSRPQFQKQRPIWFPPEPAKYY
jgi:thiosulfate dehydrogenase